MQRESAIELKLRHALAPSVIEVTNESSMHNVPKGSETHFKVLVVSEAFEGTSRVARHQLVFATLSEEMKSGIHALSIIARSPSEWAKDARVTPSPECLGGSKR